MEDYALYLRKSRADEEAEKHGSEETLARHEKMLLELAQKKKLNIVKIYREVVSGETIISRPMVQQLLNEVEQGNYAGVLVVEIERLARGDTIDQGVIAQAFKLSNTKIITPVKIYDPSNEFDEEYFEFNLFMSRREYKTINRRIQRGRIASIKEGKFITSTPPYGYIRVKIKDDKGYKLEPHPEQSEVVKMIFELYTKGELQEDGSYSKMGITHIAKKLDSLGIKPTKSEKWSRASIRDILFNPVYTGMIRWQYRKEIKKSINGKITVTRPKQEDCILVDGLHKAIIDNEIFELAKKLGARNRKTPITENKVLKNPLAGLVECGKCGAAMTRLAPSSKTKYAALKCSNHYCDNISSPLYLVEDKLLDSLENWIEQYRLNFEKNKKDKLENKKPKLIESALRKLSEEKEKLNSQLDTTYDLLEQGVYTKELFMNRNNKLASQIDEFSIRITRLEKEVEKERIREKVRKIIIPKIHNIIEVYYTIDTVKGRNELLNEAIEKVIYTKNVKNTRGKRDVANFEISLFPKIPKD